MDDEYLVDEGDVTDVVLRSVERPLPSRFRDDPRHVAPVRIEIDADAGSVRETVEQLRAELQERYGFAPREIDVTSRARGWALFVDGEPVEVSATIGRDARGDLLGALSSHLWRMLRIDDVAELVSFARLAAPVAIDRAMPHNLSIEQLHRVLVRLLREDLPIKPLDRSIELLAEASDARRDVVSQVERVRLSRRRSIVARNRQADGTMRVVTLSSGAIHACGHLSIEPMQPDARRSRFHERVRRDLAVLGAEHRLDPVVIACPARHRYSVAVALRGVCPVVVSDAELLDAGHDVVGMIGEGIRVPPPAPVLPPPAPGVHGGVWSDGSLAPQATWVSVVDVEVIE